MVLSKSSITTQRSRKAYQSPLPWGAVRPDTVQLETAINTISHEYLLEFTIEYGIPETLHPALPGPEDRILDFPEGYYQIHLSQLSVIDAAKVRHFEINCRQKAREEYSLMLHQATGFSQELEQSLLLGRRESVFDRRGLADECPQRRDASCGHDKSQILSGGQDMDLFSLIRAPNPTKVKVGSRPRAPHEVPLLTLTANRVIEMEDPATTTDSSGVPPTIERSSLDFSLETGASDQGTAASEVLPFGDEPVAAALEPSQVRVAAGDPPAATKSRKRGRDETDANAPPSHCEGIMLILGPQGALMGERASLLSFGLPFGRCGPVSARISLSSSGIAATGDPESENASSPAEVGSPGGIYRPEWGVTNGSLFDTPEACQDLVDHVAPPGYFFKLRHIYNEDFLGQYNVARRDKRIQARELEIKNLEALLETEADMKKVAEDKSARLIKELEDMRTRFSDLQVIHEHLSQQVASLKEQASGEEKLKAAFEEFKRYEDDRVERRCAELDARLDALSIDFDEELYPHMLTAIAVRKWVIGHGLRLAAMKCDKSLDTRLAFADVVFAGISKGMSEGLRHGVEHGLAQRNVESIEAYDLEAEAKFVAALQALKDLKYPLLDQLEGLKDAPIDVIMAALYLESDTGEDAP
nr:hypothetical protein [Tanacetum cinerariifolium]